jgi:glycosyltransferase involved in cell wall biosynthesis
MDKNVLFIAYYFPPLSGAGVQRPLKFVKYLLDFGWKPCILTTTEDATYTYKDYSLLKEIPENIHIERVADCLDLLARSIARLPGVPRMLEKLRGKPSEDYSRAIRNHLLRIKFLEIPDGQILWAISAYFRALKLIRDHKIDIILTTSAPYSSHLIGYWLKKRTNLSWVADFRDEWSENPILEFPTKFHHWLAKKMETLVYTYANHVVYATKPFSETFTNPSLWESKKFSTITNGFDKEDFPIYYPDNLRHDKSKFHLTHTGTFYEFPLQFFEAVELLLTSGEVSAEVFRLRIVGKISNQFKFSNPEWQEVIKYVGYLEHHQTLSELLISDALFFVVSNRRGKIMYPGKSFEYIATGKPILALAPLDSAAADLIRETKTGKVVSPDDVTAIKAALLDLYKDWQSGNLHIQPAKDVIELYERRNLTRALANIFDNVTRNSN